MTKEDEKRERFRRLGTYRTNIIIKRLKVLGNCSNRSAYSYTQEEINKIFNEITVALKETRAKFSFKEKREFKL